VTALFGEIAGQDDAQVFDGQRAELGLGQRRFQFFDEGADQGADIETVQGAGSQRDAQRGFAEAMGVSDMMGSWKSLQMGAPDLLAGARV
jgi:hypothetical protein